MTKEEREKWCCRRGQDFCWLCCGLMPFRAAWRRRGKGFIDGNILVLDLDWRYEYPRLIAIHALFMSFPMLILYAYCLTRDPKQFLGGGEYKPPFKHWHGGSGDLPGGFGMCILGSALIFSLLSVMQGVANIFEGTYEHLFRYSMNPCCMRLALWLQIGADVCVRVIPLWFTIVYDQPAYGAVPMRPVGFGIIALTYIFEFVYNLIEYLRAKAQIEEKLDESKAVEFDELLNEERTCCHACLKRPCCRNSAELVIVSMKAAFMMATRMVQYMPMPWQGDKPEYKLDNLEHGLRYLFGTLQIAGTLLVVAFTAEIVGVVTPAPT